MSLIIQKQERTTNTLMLFKTKRRDNDRFSFSFLVYMNIYRYWMFSSYVKRYEDKKHVMEIKEE
jgi:hypothetical protein